MKLRILGAHSYETGTDRFVSLLINDDLAIDAGSLTSNLSIEEQQNLKAVFISHEHYDHIRDIPGIALGMFLTNSNVSIYSISEVISSLKAHIFNNKIYPNFHELPHNNSAVSLKSIQPGRTHKIDTYEITPLKVNHSCATVGFQICDMHGTSIFYTADTGPGLATCWKLIAPSLIIIDVTFPNRMVRFATDTGHLTPYTLSQELKEFNYQKNYLPRIIAVHMNPLYEREITQELEYVSDSLNATICSGYEGMQIEVENVNGLVDSHMNV